LEPQKPDGFVADVDPLFVQKVLDVSERQREPNVEHHRETDYFW
jgi:hypothetical protein